MATLRCWLSRSTVIAAMLTALVATIAHPAPTVTDNQAAPGSAALNEPAVAVNPLDGNHVVTAANNLSSGGVSVFPSFDGARTFPRSSFLPFTGGNNQADPGLVFDTQGHVYASYLSYDPDDRSVGGLTVARSGDGGLTWPAAVLAVPNVRTSKGCLFADFSSIALDPRGLLPDRLYVAWQELFLTGSDCATPNFDKHPIKVARSDDGGVTWLEVGTLPDPPGVVTYIPVISVAPDGTVLIAYASTSLFYEINECLGRGSVDMMVASSTDGGATWTTANAHPGACFPLQVYGPVLGVGVGSLSGALYRLPANTNVVVNPVTGRRISVAAVSDAIGGFTLSVSRSADGVNWIPGASPSRLPIEQLEFPRIAAGPDGKVYLLYISEYPASILLAKMVISRDDGKTWSPPITLSSFPGEPNTPYSLGFIGDYNANAVGPDGKVHPVWTDARPLNIVTRIYTAHLS